MVQVNLKLPGVKSAGNAGSLPVSGLRRRFAALGGPLDGWQVASKQLGPLLRKRGSALAFGCGRGGRVVLPLARAAAVSNRLEGTEL